MYFRGIGDTGDSHVLLVCWKGAYLLVCMHARPCGLAPVHAGLECKLNPLKEETITVMHGGNGKA